MKMMYKNRRIVWYKWQNIRITFSAKFDFITQIYSIVIHIFDDNIIDGNVIISVTHHIDLTFHVQFLNVSAQQDYIVYDYESKMIEMDAVDVYALLFPFKLFENNFQCQEN